MVSPLGLLHPGEAAPSATPPGTPGRNGLHGAPRGGKVWPVGGPAAAAGSTGRGGWQRQCPDQKTFFSEKTSGK